ncbi:hypothetical protein MKX07_007970 [Trichoderma sp. CBMAI-0711]|nr:hypothetical protein MKX07_007970 [Trichoderma sp. CBMAI-0711]
MAFQQSSPLVKFEASPAESFLSAPGDNFTSLFADSTPSTLNPRDMMTPDSVADIDSRLSVIPESQDAEDDDSHSTSATAPSTSEKKPVKKRKSWGQVLPEPKTNLPPRKRAKTEDEKEQRRVERVLRNRRAAQSSRERKRLEVEALEKRNKELETLLINVQKTNLILVEELNRFRRSSGVVTRSSSPLDSLQDSITLSQQLFGSRDGQTMSNPEQSLMDQIMRSAANPTVNPASLSPSLPPISDKEFQTKEEDEGQADEDEEMEQTWHETKEAAAKEEKNSKQTRVSTDSTQPALDADRYLLESQLLASPNASTVDDDYLAGDSAACFTNPLPSDYDFDINDFLTDDANHAAYDIVAASNYAAADRELDLEIHDPENQIPSRHSIQQPQSGASSHGCDDGGIASCATRGDCELERCLRSVALPSREVLITLWWALKVEERRIRMRQHKKQAAALDPEKRASLADKKNRQQQQQQQQHHYQIPSFSK